MNAKPETDFEFQQEKAIERMRQMSQKAQPGSHPHPCPKMPSFVQLRNSFGTVSEDSSADSEFPAAKQHQNSQNNSPPKSKNPPVQNTGGFEDLLGELNLPFLNDLSKSGDGVLLLGLLLLLWNDKGDKRLLLALLYILL